MCSREGGRFELRFSAPADVGALVEAALSEARDALFGAGPRRSRGPMRWRRSALGRWGRWLASSRQESFRVYVHLDAEGGWLNGRPRLPGHLVAKLTCAGTVQPVWQRAGVPVSVGRALRIVPERTRRLVLDRDRGCRFPGCVARAHLEVHHVVHWVDGGRTDLANLVAVCPFHHDAHHRGEFCIGGDANVPGGLVFLARGGFAIGPGPIYARAPRSWPPTDAGVAPRPAAGQAWTIGVSTAPGRPGPGQRPGRLGRSEDLGYPDEDADPEPDGQDELWPGSHRRWPTRARPGRVLHGKWVTFHEGPPLSTLMPADRDGGVRLRLARAELVGGVMRRVAAAPRADRRARACRQEPTCRTAQTPAHAGGGTRGQDDRWGTVTLTPVKTFDQLFAELTDKAATRPAGSGTVAELDAGVHAIGKKIVEEAAEVWMAAEHEGHARTAEEISQLLYHLQVLMLASDISLDDVYAHL